MPHYNEYQYFLYETISKLREKGMTFNQVADHLNKKKILSVRGKIFRGGHIHSIMKRKIKRDEKLMRDTLKYGQISIWIFMIRVL